MDTKPEVGSAESKQNKSYRFGKWIPMRTFDFVGYHERVCAGNGSFQIMVKAN